MFWAAAVIVVIVVVVLLLLLITVVERFSYTLQLVVPGDAPPLGAAPEVVAHLGALLLAVLAIGLRILLLLISLVGLVQGAKVLAADDAIAATATTLGTATAVLKNHTN